MKDLLEHLRRWAKGLKRQTMVLWFCYQHPETPWLPKWIAIFVVAYALSPIDLIPDFNPILGYLDDVIILPLGILLAIRLMPAQVLGESLLKARAWEKDQVKGPVNKVAAVFIAFAWLAVLAGTWLSFTRS